MSTQDVEQHARDALDARYDVPRSETEWDAAKARLLDLFALLARWHAAGAAGSEVRENVSTVPERRSRS
jgi:hypothetical protein